LSRPSDLGLLLDAAVDGGHDALLPIPGVAFSVIVGLWPAGSSVNGPNTATSDEFAPTKNLADQALTGPATSSSVVSPTA
jgi:hypothetical protein